jgi:hypothetical protein
MSSIDASFARFASLVHKFEQVGAQGGPAARRFLNGVARAIVRALAGMVRNNVGHFDVKSDNFMLKLLDRRCQGRAGRRASGPH